MCTDVSGVRIAGSLTATTLGIATAGFAVAAATTAGTAAMVAYAILATLAAGASIASMTAWAASDDSEGVAGYFSTMGKHVSIAIPAAFQFVGQIFVQALVTGVAEGIGKAVSRKLGGEDVTVGVRYS